VRLLVLDQSLILQWLVRHEFPDGVEILSAQDLHEAEQILAQEPLDAAVVSLPPAQLPWGEFQHRCATHAPPIPVLYESCLDIDACSIGLDAADGYAAFLRKPAARSELHAALEALLAAARCRESRGERARSEAALSCPTREPMQRES
jgi:DNA-binding response OmpR family regulator